MEILHKFYDWLKFYRASGLEYLEETPHISALREALSLEKTGVKKRPAQRQNLIKTPRSRGRRPARTSSVSSPGYTEPHSRLTKLIKETSEKLCGRCPAAHAGNGPVYGKGPDNARLLVVYDMPGREDVRSRTPFQGEAGNMLTRMLRAIRIERSEVFLTCAIKCMVSDMDRYKTQIPRQCGRLLLKEIETIQPSFILSFGTEAAKIILANLDSPDFSINTQEPAAISELRARIITIKTPDIRLVVTHSPASMLKLRDNILKKRKMEAWHDLQLLEKMYHG